MGEVKLVTVGSEAKESMIDFSEKSGNSLFSTAGSPVTNQEQVEASSSADILLWEEGDYLEDIMQHLAHMESVTLPSVSMIEKQIQITWQLRSSLIDFVVHSHQYFRLSSQVLFLSVNLIDRYCSRKQIGKEYYLLLGSAALWIASKYDGKAYQGKGFARPSAKEISELCNGMFDEHMIAQMEISILFTLDWVLGHPTTDQGIKFLLVGEPENKELASMAAYLSEISLYHREFVGIKPSVIAESCCMLAKIILYGSLSIGDNTEAVVMETLNSLWKHVCQPPPAISEKYLRQNRHYVAQIVFSRLADSTGHATIKLGVDKKCGYMYTYYFLALFRK
ncbi:cyclin-like protein [Fusarium oxysporum]|nr:cyclin-like protein [Fusarium oxysporum]